MSTQSRRSRNNPQQETWPPIQRPAAGRALGSERPIPRRSADAAPTEANGGVADTWYLVGLLLLAVLVMGAIFNGLL